MIRALIDEISKHYPPNSKISKGLIDYGKLVHESVELMKNLDSPTDLLKVAVELSAHRIYMVGLLGMQALNADLAYNDRKHMLACNYFISKSKTNKDKEMDAEVATKELRDKAAVEASLYKVIDKLDRAVGSHISLIQSLCKASIQETFELKSA